jgi:PAS fold
MSLSDTRRADEIQREFFSRLGDAGQLLQLVDALHGIHYFIKDHLCRHIAVSQKFAERLGLGSASEMIGHTNYEFYPKLIADKFAIDDHHILNTGQPLLNIVEMLPSACGGFDWITTNKMPIFDAKGRVIGTWAPCNRTATISVHGPKGLEWARLQNTFKSISANLSI